MIKFVFIFLFSISLCFGQAVQAGETTNSSPAAALTLTLDDCIKLGFQNSKEYQIAKEQVTSAKADLAITRSAFFPTIDAFANYTYMGVIPEVEMQGMAYLPLGPGMHDHIPYSYKMKMAKENNWGAGLKITQPIFMWGKIMNSYRSSKYALKIAEEKLRQSESKILFDIKKNFYSILLAKEFAGLSEESIKQIEEYVKVAEVNYNAGMVSKYDLLSARVQLANTKPRLTQAQNAILISKLALKTMLGLDLDAEIELKGDFETNTDDEFNLVSLLQTALKNRPEIILFQLQKEIGDILISLSSAGNKPNLVFIWNYNYTYVGKESVGFSSSDPHSWNATLALSFPVSEWLPWSKTYPNTTKAKSAKKQIELTLQQILDGINLEVRQLYYSIQEIKERIKGQKENVGQADEGYQIAKTRYKNGMMMNIELMNAEVAKTQAKANYVQTLYDYYIAKVSLEKATGELKRIE